MAVKPSAIKHDFQILPLQFQSTESVLFGISRVMSGNYLSVALPRLNGAIGKGLKTFMCKRDLSRSIVAGLQVICFWQHLRPI